LIEFFREGRIFFRHENNFVSLRSGVQWKREEKNREKRKKEPRHRELDAKSLETELQRNGRKIPETAPQDIGVFGKS
jgi:hypothetical protein